MVVYSIPIILFVLFVNFLIAIDAMTGKQMGKCYI